jgi:ectoine hydroxylase-related dioxygenase (phytanoyl-CoA dioxygenase family)
MKEEIKKNGFVVIDGVFSMQEVDDLLGEISKADANKPSFRRSSELFAIRQFMREVPAVADIIFGSRLREIIDQLFGDDYFVVKSIYFDKPATSNWFVSYHQDLTISVDRRLEVEGYGAWTRKNDQFSVQPPVNVLEDNFTVRIHLDDTTGENGALKVIARSHVKGIYRPEMIDWSREHEQSCNVMRGGIMIMRPLLLHSSGRTVNQSNRRVIHIEFSRKLLPGGLNWAEHVAIAT